MTEISYSSSEKIYNAIVEKQNNIINPEEGKARLPIRFAVRCIASIGFLALVPFSILEMCTRLVAGIVLLNTKQLIGSAIAFSMIFISLGNAIVNPFREMSNEAFWLLNKINTVLECVVLCMDIKNGGSGRTRRR